MKTETLAFAAGHGAPHEIALDLPVGPPRATALIAHCFACGAECRPARRISRRLTEAGIAVARLDVTGLETTGTGAAAPRAALGPHDIHAATATLAAHGHSPDLVIGHSLAGAAVLAAAPGLPGLRAVVTIGTPFAPDPGHTNFTGKLQAALAGGMARADIGGVPFDVSADFLSAIAPGPLTEAIHGLDTALLVMHAPRDAVVGIDNARAIFAAALHPKSFVTLDDADHLLGDPADAEYAAGIIAAWATRYLGLTPTLRPLAVPEPPAPDGVVRVREVSAEGFLQEVANGPDHTFLSDEPEKVGGTNRGPNPFALLKAALGSCTSMTMRMYARVKKWPVDGITVEVRHEKVPAEEGVVDERGRPLKLDVFTREITLEGALTEDQRARLLEIANRCPVHMTLHRASRIETVLVGG